MKCEYCGVNITEGFLCAKHRAKVDAGECNCDKFSPTCTYCQIREKEEHERTQAELARLRAENVAKDAEIERLKAILADALEWGMTSKHFDAGRSLKNGEDARAALSRAEQAKPEPADPSTLQTLRAMLECCRTWSPYACVLGNITAGQIVAALESVLAQGQAKPETCVWTVSENGVWILPGCTGAQMLKGHMFIRPETCSYCKKTLIIEQAGKAEGGEK